MTERELFVAALHLQGEARVAFLDLACADVARRARIDLLLVEHERLGGFLEPEEGATLAHPAPADPAVTVDHPGGLPGKIIGGKYKLMELIGEGGMGSVWRAQQSEPVKRFVAVKLIKSGMDSKAVLARFEAERQALAVMDHPNIARILDGGVTEAGSPYFVMELVKGVPITEYCDARKLTPRQRLELFVPVCQAIQHAHQKGVIHRDIKPSNVLIALYDDRPVPKVIDFGIAKATGQALTDASYHTAFGGIVGTPEYMSPEQASLNNLDIDTRSDVYSLGVLLYELLAGSPPFGSDELKKAGMLEILRVVREEEPPRPSARLSTANALPSLSANRGTEPKKLTGLLRNELDWVVMKALEKDRARRYESANGFAADVQRYLSGDAVQAHPPSAAYRVRKFVRRHKGRVLAACLLAVALVAGLASTTWQAVRATRAEAMAEEKRKEAEANAKEAKENSEFFWKASEQNVFGRIDTEIESLSLQVDLDLAELRTDQRTGMLRLARPMKDSVGPVITVIPGGSTMKTVMAIDHKPKYRELREFVTAAVLATGQKYTSLLPPITHDGHEVTSTQLSPDHKTLFTLGADATVRLWDMRTGKPIAVLRQAKERVVNGSFSTDGKTVFTDDESSVARFWDVQGGKFRAAIDQRPNRYMRLPSLEGKIWKDNLLQVQRASIEIGGDRLLSRRYITNDNPDGSGRVPPWVGTMLWEGPVELWDTTTGRFVARLDRRGSDLASFRFLRNGQWVTSVQGTSIAVIYSAKDGRELARLVHSAGEVVKHLSVSPDGRRVATITHTEDRRGADSLRMWSTDTWQSDPKKMVLTRYAANLHQNSFQLWEHDVFGGSHMTTDETDGDGKTFIYRFGQKELLASSGWFSPTDKLGNRVVDSDGRVYDASTWRQLRPPAGQRFHPDLARFAPDGRFVSVKAPSSLENTLIDTVTQKQFPISLPDGYLPGMGLVAAKADYNAVMCLIPTSVSDLPPMVLELWAQVAVRGELGPEGLFVKWDEPTWERKRQELAAIPAPRQDLPFPGYVATDKLHWLRAEFVESRTDADKFRLARELLRRCEAEGNKIEAIRWRAVVAKSMPDAAHKLPASK